MLDDLCGKSTSASVYSQPNQSLPPDILCVQITQIDPSSSVIEPERRVGERLCEGRGEVVRVTDGVDELAVGDLASVPREDAFTYDQAGLKFSSFSFGTCTLSAIIPWFASALRLERHRTASAERPFTRPNDSSPHPGQGDLESVGVGLMK